MGRAARSVPFPNPLAMPHDRETPTTTTATLLLLPDVIITPITMVTGMEDHPRYITAYNRQNTVPDLEIWTITIVRLLRLEKLPITAMRMAMAMEIQEQVPDRSHDPVAM